jgi:tryptophan halogenase
MNCGWKSYSDFLPTNNALPYIHKFDDLKEVKMETLAWAQPNGWMWQIPTQERYGCGYVYSDMFTNADGALKELQENTGRKIEPIRNLKFDVGRVEKFWEKNVVGIGLSTGFLEPLQATSIHTTIIQIDLFVINYLQNTKKDTLIESQIKIYNQHIGKMIDDFSDLIRMQYVVDREDTDFWKYCKYELPKTEKVKQILEICKYRIPNVYDWDVYHGGAGWGVWCWTLIGSGLITKELIEKALKRRSLDMYSKSEYDRMKKQIQNASVKLKSQHRFLQDLINKKL